MNWHINQLFPDFIIIGSADFLIGGATEIVVIFVQWALYAPCAPAIACPWMQG